MYKVILSKQAIKDLEKLKRAGKKFCKKSKGTD
jgi:mRNA-degrading endonuclease RelE of RelBE toxin-antitoxin system